MFTVCAYAEVQHLWFTDQREVTCKSDTPDKSAVQLKWDKIEKEMQMWWKGVEMKDGEIFGQTTVFFLSES